MASLLAPLRHRDFRLLLAGQTISWVGNNFYEIAIMWLVLQRTGSTAAMAGVAAISALPQLVFGPIAGVYADRWNRRRTALVMDALRGLTILSLPTLAFLHHLALWQIYLVAFLLFTLFTFFLPARQAMVPNLVTDEELPAANALIQGTLGASLLLGFVLGGLVVAALGVVTALYLDAISFAGSVLTLLAIRSSGYGAERVVAAGRSALREALEGLSFMARQPALRTILIFNAVVGLLIGPLLILPAPFSRDVLHAGARGYGLLEAGFMAGGIIGAVLSPMSRHIRRVGWLLVGVVAAAGALLVAYSYMRLLAPAVIINLTIGSVTGIAEPPMMTLIQRLTPDAVRGRVNSTMMIVGTAGIPLSVAIGGAVAQVTGPAALYRIIGGLFVVMGLLCIPTPLTRLANAPPADEPDAQAAAS